MKNILVEIIVIFIYSCGNQLIGQSAEDLKALEYFKLYSDSALKEHDFLENIDSFPWQRKWALIFRLNDRYRILGDKNTSLVVYEYTFDANRIRCHVNGTDFFTTSFETSMLSGDRIHRIIGFTIDGYEHKWEIDAVFQSYVLVRTYSRKKGKFRWKTKEKSIFKID